MSAKPTLAELLLGIEELALLRLAFGEDAEARRARMSEIRALLARLEEAPTAARALASRRAFGSADCDLTAAPRGRWIVANRQWGQPGGRGR